MTAVRLPVDLHRRLHEAAQSRDTSVNHLIVKAAQHYLSRLPPLEAEQGPSDEVARRRDGAR